jgi:glutathione S-transferase
MMKPGTKNDLVLITFPPSLDSELARFLLQHYGVQHQERRHTLIFSSLVTLWHGGTVVFPLVYGDSVKLVGPRAMADFFDTKCAPYLRLWPQAVNQKSQAESDWTMFNNSLAFATASFAYYYLLPHRDLMIQPLSLGTPDLEQRIVKRAYPIFAWLLRTLLRLNPKKVRDSLDQIRNIFAQVDSRLARGARFLVGDRLTLSDLAFAVAAAPVVLPSGYGGPMPAFSQMPSEVQTVVSEMRAHPAGTFALHIYQEYRYELSQGPAATA